MSAAFLLKGLVTSVQATFVPFSGVVRVVLILGEASFAARCELSGNASGKSCGAIKRQFAGRYHSISLATRHDDSIRLCRRFLSQVTCDTEVRSEEADWVVPLEMLLRAFA